MLGLLFLMNAVILLVIYYQFAKPIDSVSAYSLMQKCLILISWALFKICSEIQTKE